MNSKMKYWTSVAKNIVLFLTTLIFIYVLFKLSIFYVPFLIGFIISQIIEPIIKKLSDKTNFTRKTCAVIVLGIVFVITIGFICYGIITLISESSNLLNRLNIYIEKINNLIQRYIINIKIRKINMSENVVSIIDELATKLLETITKHTTNILGSIIQNVTKIPIIIIYITITILSTYFICADKFYILDQLEHHVPRLWIKKIGNHIRDILSILGNYLKAEAILILISFFIVLGGLILGKVFGLNIEYPLLSALGIAFVDALPILRLRNCNYSMDNYFFFRWKFFIVIGINRLIYNCNYY